MTNTPQPHTSPDPTAFHDRAPTTQVDRQYNAKDTVALPESVTDYINGLKDVEKSVLEVFDEMASYPVDPRALALARTNLQQAFMWAVRSVANHEG